jgi:hypothetical protein
MPPTEFAFSSPFSLAQLALASQLEKIPEFFLVEE